MITGSEIHLNLVQKPFFAAKTKSSVQSSSLFSLWSVSFSSTREWTKMTTCGFGRSLEKRLLYVWPIDAKRHASHNWRFHCFSWEKWYPYQTHKQTPYPTCVFGPNNHPETNNPTTTSHHFVWTKNPKNALPENVLHRRWKVSNSIHHW